MSIKQHFIEAALLTAVLLVAFFVTRLFPTIDQTVIFGLVTVVLDRFKDLVQDKIDS